jgi:hypothetical protein
MNQKIPLEVIISDLSTLNKQMTSLRLRRIRIMDALIEQYGDSLHYEHIIRLIAIEVSEPDAIRLVLDCFRDFWNVSDCRDYVKRLKGERPRTELFTKRA